MDVAEKRALAKAKLVPGSLSLVNRHEAKLLLNLQILNVGLEDELCDSEDSSEFLVF